MKLIEKIKEIWAKIVAWVKGATSVADEFILKYAPIAVTVVKLIKEIGLALLKMYYFKIIQISHLPFVSACWRIFACA